MPVVVWGLFGPFPGHIMELEGRKELVDTGKSSRTWGVPTVSLRLAVLNVFQGFFGPRMAVRPCLSYSGRWDRITSVLLRSLDRGWTGLCLVGGGGVQGGFLVRSLVGGTWSYSVAHTVGLLPTELTGMCGWILLRSPHQGRGSPPAPASTKQRPGGGG